MGDGGSLGSAAKGALGGVGGGGSPLGGLDGAGKGALGGKILSYVYNNIQYIESYDSPHEL